MILAVDIGNSSLKAAAFGNDGSRLPVPGTRYQYEHLLGTATLDDTVPDDTVPDDTVPDDTVLGTTAIAETLSRAAADGPVPKRVAVCSVVPGVLGRLRIACANLGWPAPFEIHTGLDLPFVMSYLSPQTLGTDRIAAVAGGWRASRRADKPMLVIDAGTATTIEVVDRGGVFLGGPILAGAGLTRGSLARGTAQLPGAELDLPASAIGRDTAHAVQAGVMWGFVEGVRGVTRRILQEVGDDAVVLATGGAAELLAEHLSEIQEVRPELVLEGVAALAAANAPS